MATEKPPIIFKCEATLWDYMAQLNPDGRSVKPFDMRWWDMADERISRLSRGGPVGNSNGPPTYHEEEVSFINKKTAETLIFEYEGVKFARWAPGWGFLILGKCLNRAPEFPSDG